MKLTFIILLSIFSVFLTFKELNCSDNNFTCRYPKSFETPINEKLDCGDLDEEEQNLFFRWIYNLYNQNRVGKNLIDAIVKIFPENRKLKLIKGLNTSFNHGSFNFEINFEKMNNSITPCLGSKKTITPLNKSVLKIDVYELGITKDLPENVMGHEFIHLWHFLKNKDEFFENLRSPPRRKFYIENKDPEIEDRLWRNVEEKITVLRNPQIEDPVEKEFSELDIRASWLDPKLNLPPRYAYQAADQFFYELSPVIEEILQSHFGTKWPEELLYLHEGELFKTFEFDEERAKNSSLNRFKTDNYFTISNDPKTFSISISPGDNPKLPSFETIKKVCNLKIASKMEIFDYVNFEKEHHPENEYFEAANLIIKDIQENNPKAINFLRQKRILLPKKEINELVDILKIKVQILAKWEALSPNVSRQLMFNAQAIADQCNKMTY